MGNDATTREDERYMRRALELAKRGAGQVNPNPLVGAVVIKDGVIIGEGWHTAFGNLHAEREALAACTQSPKDATIYVTLEPCCHTGKTPPCIDAIIEAGIARVVMGAPDPNPLVAGGGVQALRAAGIEVTENVCLDECLAINKVFFHYIQTKLPYVTAKYAMTLDGKIATRTGKSKWITSETARRRVHEDRNKAMAIMVGVNTVLKDDPELTCRLDEFDSPSPDHLETLDDAAFEQQLEEELTRDDDILESGAEDARCGHNGVQKTRNPIRIICDTHLRTPLTSRIVQSAYCVPTYIATAETDFDKHLPYRERDCDILVVATADGHLDLVDLMRKLGEMGIDSVIVEGGAQLIWSAFAFEVVNEVQAYIAPKVFGGKDAPGPTAGLGVESPAYAIELGEPHITMLGEDILVECEVK